MPIVNATDNFDFNHLDKTDQAGYNSINGLVTKIDEQLYTLAVFNGMVVAYDGHAAVPQGWSEVSGNGLPALTPPYKWIKKD